MTRTIQKIDETVLRASINWESATTSFLRNRSSRLPRSGLTVENHLIYVRALSRVLIDLETHEWNEKLPPEDHIYIMAPGSTNITSDYDVTMAGKNASKLAEHINTRFTSDTNYDLSTYADTNLYFNPWMLMSEEQQKDRTFLSQFRKVSRFDRDNLYLPFPVGGDLQDKDRAMALERLKQSMDTNVKEIIKGRSSIRRQNTLYALAGRIETMLYTNWQILKTANDFNVLIDLMHQSQALQPDAYWTLASLAIVVVEMNSKTTDNTLGSADYITCALENMACVAEHGILLPVGGIDTHKLSDENIIQTIKYMYRVIYCLHKAGQMTSTINQQTVDTLDRLNKSRGNSQFMDSIEYRKYKEELPSLLVLCATFHTTLVGDGIMCSARTTRGTVCQTKTLPCRYHRPSTS